MYVLYASVKFCISCIFIVMFMYSFVMYVVLRVFCFVVLYCVLFLCKCVLYYFHWVFTKLQLTNI